MPPAAGFSLIELLLAMMITAIVGLMAFGGLDAAMSANERNQAQNERMREINLAMVLLSRDLRQTRPRSIRIDYDEHRTAFYGGDGDTLIALTRSGWQNPAGRARSDLQRVLYRFEDGKLQRELWTELDYGSNSRPRLSTLLRGVEEVQVRFLKPIIEGLGETDEQSISSEWVNSWGTEPALLDNPESYRPPAVEIVLELQDWGKIRRVFEIAPYWPSARHIEWHECMQRNQSISDSVANTEKHVCDGVGSREGI